MAKEIKTNAMRQMEAKKLPYGAHSYPHEDGAVSADQVAAILNQAPGRVFKTLVTRGKSGKLYVFMLPSDGELDLKKAAVCAGEKSVDMLPSKELLPMTGYVHGGCSPVGMKKLYPTWIHETARDWETVFFSGGQIGLQMEMPLETLQKAVPVKTADLLAKKE